LYHQKGVGPGLGQPTLDGNRLLDPADADEDATVGCVVRPTAVLGGLDELEGQARPVRLLALL